MRQKKKYVVLEGVRGTPTSARKRQSQGPLEKERVRRRLKRQCRNLPIAPNPDYLFVSFSLHATTTPSSSTNPNLPLHFHSIHFSSASFAILSLPSSHLLSTSDSTFFLLWKVPHRYLSISLLLIFFSTIAIFHIVLRFISILRLSSSFTLCSDGKGLFDCA